MIVPQIPLQGAAARTDGPPDRVFTGHPVRLPVFEGPLDLLLYLIEREEVDVFDIPIERITSQYLEYLAALESLDIEVAGEFIVMAAQLLEIKSRMLLPKPERPQPDEEEVGDPRAQLIAQLIEYRRYKAVAEDLRERAEVQQYVFSRARLNNGNGNGNGHGEQGYVMLNDVSAFDLWAAFQSVLSRFKEPAVGEVTRPRYTVAQKMAVIASRLRWAPDGVRFVDLFEGAATRLELVVTFLALLELVRLRRARVGQERPFGEILVWPAGATQDT